MERVEILTQHSSRKGIVTFRRLPECYFTKLGNYVDTTLLYMTFSRSIEAIKWLFGDVTGNSKCEDDFSSNGLRCLQ